MGAHGQQLVLVQVKHVHLQQHRRQGDGYWAGNSSELYLKSKGFQPDTLDSGGPANLGSARPEVDLLNP